MLGQVFVAKLLALVTGQIHQELLDAIDYLQEEIRVLRRNSPRRLRLTNTDRMTLAQKAQKLGRGIAKVANIVTPDTLYRWHRKFVAQKFDGSKKRNYPGRPTKRLHITRTGQNMGQQLHPLVQPSTPSQLTALRHPCSETRRNGPLPPPQTQTTLRKQTRTKP